LGHCTSSRFQFVPASGTALQLIMIPVAGSCLSFFPPCHCVACSWSSGCHQCASYLLQRPELREVSDLCRTPGIVLYLICLFVCLFVCLLLFVFYCTFVTNFLAVLSFFPLLCRLERDSSSVALLLFLAKRVTMTPSVLSGTSLALAPRASLSCSMHTGIYANLYPSDHGRSS
jgi:hypothetical protein